MCDPRRFGIKHLCRAASQDRHQRYGKYDHTDTSLPLGEASPEQDTFRQCLYIGEYGRSGSRETRHGFKESIRYIVDISSQVERQHSQQREQQPGKRNRQHPFPSAGCVFVCTETDGIERYADPEQDSAGDKQWIEIASFVQESDHCCHQHKQCFEDAHHPQHFYYETYIQ